MPKSKIAINARTINKILIDLEEKNAERTGKSRATSTSKIKKSTTNKKKRVENGARILLKGSNPHSKGVIFSS